MLEFEERLEAIRVGLSQGVDVIVWEGGRFLFQGGEILIILHAVVMQPLILYPCQAGPEHAEFSLDQARNQIPSVKRRDVFDVSHEG